MSVGSRIVGDGFAEIVKALGPTTWKREKKGFDEAPRQSRAWDEKGSKRPAGETPSPFLVRRILSHQSLRLKVRKGSSRARFGFTRIRRKAEVTRLAAIKKERFSISKETAGLPLPTKGYPLRFIDLQALKTSRSGKAHRPLRSAPAGFPRWAPEARLTRPCVGLFAPFSLYALSPRTRSNA